MTLLPNSERNSILCPGCRRLINTSEPRCPYCGTRRPGAWWNRIWSRELSGPARLVRTVIGINIVMYILSLALDFSFPALTTNPLHWLAPQNRSLLLLGGSGTIPIDRFGRVWTVVSAMYLHGSLLHILFNMYAFAQLAPVVIREYGGFRATTIYTLGGITSFALSYRTGQMFSVGASGAVFALIGALIYYGKSRGGAYGQAIYRQLGIWTLVLLAIGYLVPGIDNWAHAGGFLGGIAFGYLFGYLEKRPESRLDRVLGRACAVATVVILVWAAASGIYYRTQV